LATEQAPTPQRVLVTGSAGAVGNAVCLALLARGHTVRGVDQRPTPNLANIKGADAIEGDLADKEVVYRAVEGMDTVIHLAAYVNNGELVGTLLRPNVISPYYICEAARELGVKRLVLASSVQVIEGFGHPGRSIGVDEGLRPRNLYAMTKAWGEIMGDMYAKLYDLSVIHVRIGWLPRSQEQANAIARSEYGQNIYLSYADAQRFFVRCVEAGVPAAGESIVLFAGSKSKGIPHMDLEPARRLIGYEPRDQWPENMPFTVAAPASKTQPEA
jgi:nucleoside-diphosphate-sugar epimerase